MDIQYVIVYLIVGLAAWQLIKRMIPRKKKAGAGACTSCASTCGPAEKPAADWASAPAQKR